VRSLARISSTCSVLARRGAGSLLRRDLVGAEERDRRRANLSGPGGVATVVAVLSMAFTAGPALASSGHLYLGKATVTRAKGKGGDEEAIIIGHSKGGKREKVIVGGPEGSIGHVSAARGPDGGIGHVTVTGPSGG
jgi:hypothetical protein